MREYIIAILTLIIAGLGWLVYKHPKQSRTLLAIIYGVGMLAFLIWQAYGWGLEKSDRFWFKQTGNLEISQMASNYSDLVSFNSRIFGLCLFLTYFIFLGLSFFFENIQSKKNSN